MLLGSSVFLVSASLLAYEILLMNIFSITSWSHFAYMVISLALLGFGASGTFLSLLRERIKRKFHFFFIIFSLLYGASIFLSVWATQLIPFTPFLLVWYRVQYLYLFSYYIILAIPFFLGASCIGMSFIKFGGKVPKLYFYNMVGSGMGTLFVILLMYLLFPIDILLFLSILGFSAALIYTFDVGKRYSLPVFLILLCLSSLFYLNPPTLNVSEYKGLSKTLENPETRVLKQYFSPLGLVQVVKSPSLRYAPGLSLNFEQEVPSQLGIFADYTFTSAINNLQEKDISSLTYLDYLTSSAPYHLLKQPEVLVLGAGGGTEVANALYHGAKHVDAVEVNPQIIHVVKEDFAEFAGNIYSLQKVDPILAEARGYTERTSRNYDLIQISLLDSFAASSAGVYATSESYLYTTQAIARFMEKLAPNGLLCITRWVKNPPRDGIKMLATVTEALEKMGEKNPEKHIIMIRSWSTSSLIVAKSPIPASFNKRIIDFTEKKSFDLCWYPGITEEEVNRFHILPEPYFYQAAKKIFSPQREKFYREYLFNIAPPTDDSPYFFHFFKWKSLPYLLQKLGKQWIPFIEWGYIILTATLLQAIIASMVLIILPLVFLSRRETIGKIFPLYKLKVFSYFLCLGFAYMFLEISFIQRFTLFLHYPVYSAAVVITGFLLFSGLGSYFSSRFVGEKRHGIILAVIGIGIISAVYIVFLKDFFLPFIGLPDPVKIVISLVLIGPLAFFMGMPFPLGLTRTEQKEHRLVPWAWGVNGCASVISSVLATVLAVSFSFSMVGFLAMLLYALAYLSYP